jgi:YVTN family beta-propeller protein
MPHRWNLRTPTTALALLALAALVAGCPASSDDDDDMSYWDDDDASWDDDDDDSYVTDDDDDTPPPEEEDDFLVTEPRGTDRYVFVANPDRDTVSRIDVVTRQIEAIEVGGGPVQVVVSSDYQRAVTFNADADSVSVIDIETKAVTDLPVREDFNYIAISPDGRWVIAWFNAAIEDSTFDIEGVRSFTEVSFVDTIALTVESYSVGFNPKQIRFTAGGSRAVIVSDTHLTLADLSSEPIALDLLDLGADPLDPPTASEVEIIPSGEWAFVRYFGDDYIQAVNLESGELGTLDGGDTPTDLDLSVDAAQVLVVSRGSSELRIFDANDPLSTPVRILETPPERIIGSLVLSADGEEGLLFTTAAREDVITVWDTASDAMVTRTMVKPIRAVAPSPDGGSALVIHTLEDAEGEDDLFTDSYAMTVVDLDTWITNPVGLEDEPTRWTTSPDGAWSMFIMEGNRHVGVVDYATRLVDDVSVPSLPVHVGMLPLDVAPEDALGWVSQQHELGRISFVTPADLTVQTVTGFELNGGID